LFVVFFCGVVVGVGGVAVVEEVEEEEEEMEEMEEEGMGCVCVRSSREP
jgi:hypothetical protein